ncbi:MAG: response regulator [Gemmatimonadota bacterium]|jgi:CheY-like chemotaxis protein|nr:response regulator [Gemmatimonadota bacterium]
MQRPILVVDDDDGVRALAGRILESCGYVVSLARHAYEALELLVDRNGAFRLLLTDVRMPGLNGVELMRRVRTLWPEVPCLCMTGWVEERGALENLVPPCPVLRKPFSPDELAWAVAGLVGPP